ncbi:MAG: flagellar biosynthesis protein FlgA [Mycobacterium sp.]|jgi:Flp pilus assembly protein CpaB|uniref:Flagellar biosynthesis protein FlgA n=1 Tax=Mycobacterium gordonae TaxID=1778 RepID=A0A1A6BM32_MYCGO|nr:SAF domain-containing protein [Mycobacterium gordonae]MBI2702796.1 flagella basal body P-ring formation protein FlgA [Mycobacterium sp.]MBX9982244.1 flagella basal body P-ring formation protein FlgA [Mycobacterium gordonae]MCQ4359576.1 SAF domain-containing protein [Mycobacterium gordonae]OBS03398.1 flagellar biosynthesis protein FlgA [Mycobacterium gordonae]PJE18311.1 MAG: flagellar biosynthesis protein FlgA [Mycobacterium sp.]
MGDSLNPTLASRISTVLRPDWTRTVLARRVAAGGLVVLAGIAALRSDPEGDRVEVLVAARDLGSGAALNDSDVRTEKRLATTVPEGSMTDPGRVIGATLASPTRRGEVLTDVRLLGSRLAESTAGPGARIVPLHLADEALIDLLRVGDVVDVLAAPAGEVQRSAVSKVIATDAVVVLVSAKEKLRSSETDRVVLVALPAHVANTVAGSALGQTVTLTLH